MDENEKKALDLIAQAKKKEKGGGGVMSFLFGQSGKAEEAISLYERAANSFKMAKKWSAAGEAFCSAGQLCLDTKSKHEAATHYVNAATCYKKTEPKESIQCFMKAIEIYTEMGRFTIAAKHHMSVAEVYEQELADIEKAIQHYEQAADFYQGEESNSAANKCILKVAHFAAQLQQYEKASQLFERVGKVSMENNLLRYGAKEYFFKSVLCLLCLDLIRGQSALKTYEEMFPTFTDSREHSLILKLIGALEQDNVEEFTTATQEYDSISRLDAWLTSVLLKIKKTMEMEVDVS